QDFCRAHTQAQVIAFDTEFVSEDTYGPELCLIQVAADGHLAIIDPLSIRNHEAFWQLLAAAGHETIVHSGREEFRFCLIEGGQRPTGWFDVQIAAAFVGMEYPAAYSNLISRLLGKNLSKGETRTDWRKRPLSKRQLDYAVQDVLYLQPMRNMLHERMVRLGRESWFVEELTAWQDQLAATLQRPSWRRLAGIAGLSARQLAIARALWMWRDEEARQRNCPPRRLLRDDLVVELARRESADPQRIRAVRGLEFRHVQRYLPAIAATIEHAMNLDEAEWPRPIRSRSSNAPQLTMLAQFLNTALGCICRSIQLTPGIVATVDDVRELVAYRMGLVEPGAELPALARGWRAEVIGKVMEDLLDGRLAIRIVDPLLDQPLALEPVAAATPSQPA
ncbi:MAG: ribonuclease D, partial [Pirellulaceae bacterium]